MEGMNEQAMNPTPADIAVDPADPNCATCKGTGKVTSRHDGRTWPCLPCQVRLDYEESRSRAC